MKMTLKETHSLGMHLWIKSQAEAQYGFPAV